MNFFRQLTEKPWLPDPYAAAVLQGRHAPAAHAVRTGLKMFLIIVGVLFMLLAITYAGRMAFEDWRPVPQPWLMRQNTIVLILGGVAMQLAQTAARRDQWGSVKIGLLAGGVLTIAFLIGQLLAWRQLVAQGVFELTNPAVALFILITGLHGLHLLGGLIAWGRTTDKVWRHEELDAVKLRQSVGNCTLYWHFLLAVWLVLFGLLFSGNDNLSILLTLCGIK